MEEVFLVDNFFHFKCPNCTEQIIVLKKQIRCKIFRHGIYKSSFKQVNPHMSKEKCEKLIKENKVYGCCKPFEIIFSNENKIQAIVCDYK
jgi:hypothetical protein